MKTEMEYSMEVFNNGLLLCDISESSHPYTSNFPIDVNVNPGIGLMVNMYHTFVPIYGKPFYLKEKKYEEPTAELHQTGKGPNEEEAPKDEELNKNDRFLEAKIRESLNHPKLIETERIVFPRAKVSKRKIESQERGASVPKKLKHSFVFSNL